MYTFKPHVFTEHFSNNITRPEERTKSHIHCNGKNVYIYGGENISIDGSENEIDYRFCDVWSYSLTGKQWREMTNEEDLPADLDDLVFGAIFEANYLVLCSIQEPLNDELSSKKCRLHIYDLNTGSLRVRETNGQIPKSFLEDNLIRLGKYLYTVGIIRGREMFSDVYKLNIEDGIWEVVYSCRGLNANEPDDRSGHTIVYDNNMIYMFGGLKAEAFDEIPAFDLEKRCWKKVYTYGDKNHIPHYPTERECFGVTSYTDPDSGEINVIISGGQEYDDNRDYYRFNDIWQLNLTSSKWTCLERFGAVLPHYVTSNSMAVSPAGQLFTFGGFTFPHDMEQGTSLSTLHSTWLRIPKLTDICREAVFHYFPNLTSMTEEEINSLSLPSQLLKLRIN
ncbi:kelch domain-containing protein 10 homolog [Microplitis mediator]|uniref:kelch domain-containing protein 10 homolog n=1 Tax=Microplitis mediator TaxID=375433 RepID=UPI0025540C3A|nr:kelch domain-containing protein 10 homolog [Microplitis mediator]